MEKSFFVKLKEFFGFQEETKSAPELLEDPNSSLKSFKGSLVHTKSAQAFSSNEIIVEEPRIYEDSLNIATQLRENKPVVVNLKFLDKQSSKRLVDFVCGTAYAINGHMIKLGENIFMFTPANVQIVNSEEKSTLEQGIEKEEQHVFFKKVSSL